jgi:methyl-accepting chemotaxis protein
MIQSWNQRNGRSRALFFNMITWEDLVAPDIGDSPQDVINQQVGDDYDIFLGVMWSRFGTPTTTADSGTEEEFERAVLRHRAGEEIAVSFLIKTADIPTKSLDGIQFSKVQDFRTKLTQMGCFYREFVDDSSLQHAVNLVLDNYANKMSRPQNGSAPSQKQTGIAQPNVALNVQVSELDDDGLFEVSDQIEHNGKNFTDAMTEWSQYLASAGEIAENVTEEINTLSRYGKPEQADFRKAVNKVTSKMTEFADWGKDKIEVVEIMMDEMSVNYMKLVEISSSFDESDEDISNSIKAIENLIDVMISTNVSMDEFIKALENLPKLSKPLNQANRKLVDIHKRLVAKNEIFRENLIVILDQLNDNNRRS